MKWVRDTQLGLVFVCIWQKALQLLYIDELLDKVRKKFSAAFKDQLQSFDLGASFEFSDQFGSIHRKCEKDSMEKSAQTKAPRAFEESKKWEKTKAGADEIMHGIKAEVREGKRKDGRRNRKKGPDDLDVDSDDDDDWGGSDEEEGADPAAGAGGLSEAQRLKNLEKLRNRGKGGKKAAKTPPPSPGNEKSPGKKKKKKEAREWAGQGARTKKEKEALDFSDDKPSDEAMEAQMDKHRREQFGDPGEVELDGDYFNEESSEEEEEEAPAAAKKGGMFSMFTNLVSGKVLDRDDIEPVLRGTRESLVEKNVAVDIADRLCDSVCKSLEGKKMDSWTGVKGTVKAALESELTRILTPKQSLDIVREIHHVRQQGRPFVIVFCGVNGVGKSTSLAKVCNWLLRNDMKVLIAACDTFRAGAVEQLKVHSRALGVEVFDQGYGKDAAGIAQEAVRHASKPEVNSDVVLVDTAGRMQDNEPLMRALAKLVALNKPDLSLFVGEALVGNDSVDQLKKFNQVRASAGCLRHLSRSELSCLACCCRHWPTTRCTGWRSPGSGSSTSTASSSPSSTPWTTRSAPRSRWYTRPANRSSSSESARREHPLLLPLRRCGGWCALRSLSAAVWGWQVQRHPADERAVDRAHAVQVMRAPHAIANCSNAFLDLRTGLPPNHRLSS